MSDARRSTIATVADAARVSISTVSLVMNGKGPVADETRQRVLSAAERLGYVPTRAAQHLAGQRTGNVGFVLREDHFTRSEPFYTRIFLGTEFEARHRNLYVLLTTIPAAYTPGRDTPRFLRERSVDGLVVAGKVDPAFLDEVAGTGLPVVLVDFAYGGLPAITLDNAGGAREAVAHLVARGHTRVAFVGADLAHPSLAERYAGYRSALADAGLAEDAALVFTADDLAPTRLLGQRLGRRLLDASPRPTAVFCANDALALGVLDAARAASVAVPGALAVAGFDDVEGAVEAVPPLTTVRVFKEQIGEIALRTLAEALADRPAHAPNYDRGSPVTRISTELVVRGSS